MYAHAAGSSERLNFHYLNGFVKYLYLKVFIIA
jgi:hypothetical protein